MLRFTFTAVTYWLLSWAVALAQMPYQYRRPTNSVTIKIRQSGMNTCANHAEGEFMPHTSDCKLFFLCTQNGYAVLANCPQTMVFNAETKLCDKIENVKCNNNSTGNDIDLPVGSVDDLNSTITDAAAYCATLRPQQSNDHLVYVGSSSSCSQFYICYYGQAILQDCTSELHWNAATGRCDLPELAQCTLPALIPPQQQQQQQQQQQLTSSFVGGVGYSGINSKDIIRCPTYGEHLFPHMKNCEFFVYCVKGHATLQHCPFYYFFDVASRSCRWSRTALCVRDLNFKHRSQ